MKATLGIVTYTIGDINNDLIESIRKQSVKFDEVIVTVDKIDDDARNTAKKWKVRLLLNKKGKLFHARNLILRNTKTDILCFTDSDCVLGNKFLQNVKRVFGEHPEVGGGTGRHPQFGKGNWVSWLHYMWYLAEAEDQGYTQGVIGGNSYFRVSALKKVGGWAELNLMASEDVNIASKLTSAGYKLWLDNKIIAYHKGYRKEFGKLWNQAIKMGKDIVMMMDAEKRRDFLYYYTISIPFIALLGVASIILMNTPLFLVIFGGTFLYWVWRLKSVRKAFPRYIARWVLIFPYSVGIIKGILRK
jgi:cellulose synthase/poly-beta-1,6-N-acetylglucosamine synthase-like glycosyltransferase